MSRTEAAAVRVVEIQNLLITGRPVTAARSQLMQEQRLLWDSEFPNKPFELIVGVARHA